MTTILFVWTIVAAASGHGGRDWRPMGEFSNEVVCKEAARQLAIKPESFRCVSTGKSK